MSISCQLSGVCLTVAPTEPSATPAGHARRRDGEQQPGGVQAQWCIVQVSVAVSETTKHGSAGPDTGGTNRYSLFLQFSSARTPVFLSFCDFASSSALQFSLSPDRLSN